MSDILLAILAGFLLGAFAAAMVILLVHRKLTNEKLGSVTRMLFVSIPFHAFAWVDASYAIAIYSTVHLQQVYTMAELSTPAITVLLAALLAKVMENTFEHNNGALFGHSNRKENEQ